MTLCCVPFSREIFSRVLLAHFPPVSLARIVVHACCLKQITWQRDIRLTRLEKGYAFPEGRGCLEDSEQHLGSISKEVGPVAGVVTDYSVDH